VAGDAEFAGPAPAAKTTGRNNQRQAPESPKDDSPGRVEKEKVGRPRRRSQKRPNMKARAGGCVDDRFALAPAPAAQDDDVLGVGLATFGGSGPRREDRRADSRNCRRRGSSDLMANDCAAGAHGGSILTRIIRRRDTEKGATVGLARCGAGVRACTAWPFFSLTSGPPRVGVFE